SRPDQASDRARAAGWDHRVDRLRPMAMYRTVGVTPSRNQIYTMRSIGPAGLLLALAATASPLVAQDGSLVVRGLHFKGNKSSDNVLLEASMATTNSAWLARSPLFRWIGHGEKRLFNERQFRAAVERVRLLYRLSGFFEIQVDTTVERSAEAIDLTFHI